ncbi:MAG: ABC transporter permease [Pseudomonadota bacterium]
MVGTLALRNLFHDRIRLIVTLVGILFSVVLVAVQLGLYMGARKMIIGMIDNANAQIWITAFGTKSFEEAPFLNGSERFTALSTPGVAGAIPLVVSFAQWRKPGGGSQLCVVVGTDPKDNGLKPWNVIAGSPEAVSNPNAVMVDRSYLSSLAINGMGDTAQIENVRVEVAGMTDGIRSFTTAPYVFTSLTRARRILGGNSQQATFFLVQVKPGVDVKQVQTALRARLPNREILTTAEFRNRSLDHWLFGTGAGIALIGGALLGLLVGTVIVAQTLYSSTKDHLNEFATLRALGSSKGYINKVILAQAGLSAIMGYALGMSIALAILYASRDTALPIVMTPGLAVGLFTLTLGMCAISAVSAIMKVTRIDPAMVFAR